MARTDNLSNFLIDVAAAIKIKKGNNINILAANFDTEILAIPTINNEQKTVTPTINGFNVEPSAGYTGLSKVVVNPVTSAIDYNIQPQNIKDGVKILDVIGTYEGSGGGINYDNTNLIVSDIVDKSVAYSKFTTLYPLPNITNMSGAFMNNSDIIYLTTIDTNNITDMSNMFSNCSNLYSVPNLETINVINAENLFNGCSNLHVLPTIMNVSNIENANGMLNGCSNLTNVPNLELTNLTNACNMFANCMKLEVINLNVSNLQNTSYMFSDCSNLSNLPVFDMTNVTNAEGMFMNCNNFSSDTLENIADSLPNADQLTNQYIANLGLNLEQFAPHSITIMYDKGYVDAVPVYNPSPNYHIIYD